MTGINTLLGRIDNEIAAEVGRQRAVWAEVGRANRERGLRLQRYEAAAQHVVDLLKPRLAAFTDRFKTVVKGELADHDSTRAVRLAFACTVAKAALLFEMSPDRDVNHVRLQCTQEIIPVLVQSETPSVLEIPLDAVRDEAVVTWFDDRIVAFARAYIALVRQDEALQEVLGDQFVEDPVIGVRFPKNLAASTVECDGRTYYFLNEDTRREFEKKPAAEKKEGSNDERG
jgi:YHS domain-containing protein